ncbi:MAG: GIY-YIG nuclease family protein [Candidatus Omnitrophica bacterium]|nr:GIY-YIG nuclease family protein [Candidatus Omnitrophota bacterium]
MDIREKVNPVRGIKFKGNENKTSNGVKKLPLSPGVYIMKSNKGKVIYVGKATSLRKRVSSYFSKAVDSKTDSLLKNIGDIDHIECVSPGQALILEAALIKEKKPKYNISLRDNKSYPYVEITKEKFPRIFISRPKQPDEKILFGPYPQAKTLKPALTLIRRVFPYRSCGRMPKSVCLFFHLKLCPAPCAGKVTLNAYKNTIKNICRILKGQRKELVKELTAKMKKAAVEKKFEQAKILRDKLLAIDSLYKGNPKVHEIISLKEILNLSKLPLCIEAIDVSSLGRNDCVGSVVVFRDGISDKNSYRRFQMKTARERDDYDMIGEVIRRRYSRLVKEKSSLPDLIIVDGGKGHLARAHKELELLGIFTPLIGLAKRNEEIWTITKKVPLIISRSNPGLHLIQKVRDEAHRFAHSYGLVCRKKRIMNRKGKLIKLEKK